jgi:subtilisin family serine protease
MADEEIVPPAFQETDTGDGRVPGHVYIRLNEGAVSGVASTNLSQLPVYNQEDPSGGVASTVTSTGISDVDTALSQINTSGLYRLVAEDTTAVASADGTTPAPSELGSVILVQFADTTPIDTAIETLQASPSVAEVTPMGWFTIALTVDDPEFASQWGLTHIHAPDAWDTTTGDASVVVAVVDTGCDAAHVDLAPILTGATFVPGTTTSQDDHGHGTHVAGIIAGLGNNATNIAGIAWGCWILPVKVLSSGGSAVGASIAQGINYAGQNARIINCSIQGSVDDLGTRTAVAGAIARGALVVAAMGNFGWTETKPSYPAAYPGVLAVGAVDQNHKRSIWSATQSSNQGSWITVAAPGTNILSLRNGGGTTSMSGTSQACPHVAGIAALLASFQSTITASEIWTAIYQSAVILKDNDSDPVPNPQYGGGLADAKLALDYIRPTIGDFPTPTDDGTRVG